MNVKKYKLKYDYLQLELKDTQDALEEYIEKWNQKFGKFFQKKEDKRTVWVNEETGEVRESPPDQEEKVDKRNKVEKYKKLYRKLSMKLHPDHGGKEEEFLRAKKAYDDENVFELLDLAEENKIQFILDEEDVEYLEKTCSELEAKIADIKQTLPYIFNTGNLKAKMAVINKVEELIGYKIRLEDLSDLL